LRPAPAQLCRDRKFQQVYLPYGQTWESVSGASPKGVGMNFLDANLSVLRKSQPELASCLLSAATHGIDVFSSAHGFPTAVYRRGDSLFPLHSRYDPPEEARRSLKRSDLTDANYFILFGFGLGYPLEALAAQRRGVSDYFFVVESELSIIRAAFEARDLREMLSLPNLHFAWPVAGPELAEQWRKFFDPVRAFKSVIVSHGPSLALAPGLFKAAAEAIHSQTAQIFIDINTLVGKSRTFLDNFVKNLPVGLPAPGVADFEGKFAGVPAIIVSAGPSLDKNLHELRATADRALIVAADTTLKPLLAAGVDPHFVVTADPGYENYLHLRGAEAQRSILVAEATTYPDSLQEFSDRVLLCNFENSSLRTIGDLIGKKGTLRAWGSVATMALDFALLLGCDPIIFVGQDLAYTDGRTYCSGVHFEKQWFQGVTNPIQWQEACRAIRSTHRTVLIEDIFGKPVESTDQLTSYWIWIAKELQSHPERHFINASEGGILKENASIMSLKEALYRHCSTMRSLRSETTSLYASARAGRQPEMHQLKLLQDECAAVELLLQRGNRLIAAAEDIAIPERARRLSEIKHGICSNSRILPVIDCFNQMGNIAFLRGLAAGDSGTMLTTTYADYFASVHETLAIISPALQKINAIFSETTVPANDACR
jgi:hypothetical protein